MADLKVVRAQQMGGAAGKAGVNMGVKARSGNILDGKFLDCINYLLLIFLTPYTTQNSFQTWTLHSTKFSLWLLGQSLSGLQACSDLYAFLFFLCFPKCSQDIKRVPRSNMCVKHWVKQSYIDCCSYRNSQIL